jgi:predicted O-methyltransferase YrrM
MVNSVLERLYRQNEVVHRNGRRMRVVPPGILPQRGEYLFRLVRERRPQITLETGFAYGLSTLFIAEGLRQNGRGRHIVIDPHERTRFDGLGLAHVEEANLGPWVTFHDEPSEIRLPKLIEEGVRLDLAFVDGHHLFDYVVTDCLLLGQMLSKGGLLVMDDTNLPGVARACDFFSTNRPDFEELTDASRPGLLRRLVEGTIPPPPKLFRVFRRIADTDPRSWDSFVPF